MTAYAWMVSKPPAPDSARSARGRSPPVAAVTSAGSLAGQVTGSLASTLSSSQQSAGAALTAGSSAGGCLERGPPGGLGGRFVAGAPADHRQNGLGVRVVQTFIAACHEKAEEIDGQSI